MSCFGYSRSQLWLFPYPTGESLSLLICKHTNIPFWRLKDSPVRQAVPTGNLTRRPGAVVSVPGSLGHVADLGPCAPGGNSETWGCLATSATNGSTNMNHVFVDQLLRFWSTVIHCNPQKDRNIIEVWAFRNLGLVCLKSICHDFRRILLIYLFGCCNNSKPWGCED